MAEKILFPSGRIDTASPDGIFGDTTQMESTDANGIKKPLKEHLEDLEKNAGQVELVDPNQQINDMDGTLIRDALRKTEQQLTESEKAQVLKNIGAEDMETKTHADTTFQTKGNYAVKGELPTKVSQLENDAHYLTTHQDISGKLDKGVYEKEKASFATKVELGGKVDKTTYQADKAEANKYGIHIDYAHEGKVIRTGNMSLHKVFGGLPVQKGIIAGYLTDDGMFTPIDWSKPEEIIKDGSKGQMMARIPKHYYTFAEDASGLQIDLNCYPSKGAIEIPLHYVSMYEASIARDTNTLASVVNLTANYRGGGNQADRDGQDNTLLGRPVTAKSPTSFREAAKRRGRGWIDYDEFVHADLAMLFYIEYGTLNVQKPVDTELTPEGYRQGGLGVGVTNLNGSAWSKFNGFYPFIPCGHSDILGNNSGEVEYKMPKAYNDAAGDGKEHSTFVPRFHCIENLFGHIYKWVDGVLIDIQADNAGGKSKLHVCRDIDKMSSTITEDYEYVGDIARTNGYVIKIIIGGKYGLLIPREAGGSSVSYFCDYSYTFIPEKGNSLRALCVGGGANSGSNAGFAYAHSAYSPSSTAAILGSRSCFFPRNYDNNIII